MLAEYQKAPAVTRDRMYIDTMQQIYSNVTKVLVDTRSNANLLYLPLDKLMQQSGPAVTPARLCVPGRRRRTEPSTPGSAPPTFARATASARRDRDAR